MGEMLGVEWKRCSQEIVKGIGETIVDKQKRHFNLRKCDCYIIPTLDGLHIVARVDFVILLGQYNRHTDEERVFLKTSNIVLAKKSNFEKWIIVYEGNDSQCLEGFKSFLIFDWMKTLTTLTSTIE